MHIQSQRLGKGISHFRRSLILLTGTALVLAAGFGSVAPAQKASALTCGARGIWSTAKAYSYSPGGWCMQGQYQQLVWQTDGNLVQYSSIGGYRSVHWASNTAGRGKVLSFQTDGNIVIYTSTHVALWANGAHVKAGYPNFSLNVASGGMLFETGSGAGGTVQMWSHN